jgi:hypothetical protein
VPSPNNGEAGLFFHLFPYMEQQTFYNSCLMPTTAQGPNGNNPTFSEWGNPMQDGSSYVKTLLCPSDPTYNMGWAPKSMLSSYAVNGQVFLSDWGTLYNYAPLQRYPAVVTDGTSQTIFFTEKEAVSYGGTAWAPTNNINIYPNWGSLIASNELGAGQPIGPAAYFQVMPPLGCTMYGQLGGCGNGNLANSPHTGGIMAAMGDGSVHLVAQGASPNTWWYALTPSAGDLLGPDW